MSYILQTIPIRSVGNNYHLWQISDDSRPVVLCGDATVPRNEKFAHWLREELAKGSLQDHYANYVEIENGGVYLDNNCIIRRAGHDIWQMAAVGDTITPQHIIGLINAHKDDLPFLHKREPHTVRLQARDARNRPITFFVRLVNHNYSPVNHPDRLGELRTLALTFVNTMRAEMKLPILDQLICGQNHRRYIGNCDSIALSLPGADIGEETILATTDSLATALTKHLPLIEETEFELPAYV